MTQTNPGTGGCLCGAVRYKLHEAPTEFGACHCNMCRKFSGGVEMGLECMPGGITWEGEENIRTYTSSVWAERGFCGTCGSNLFWRLTAEGPMRGLLALTAGSLDSLDGLTFTREVYVDHQPKGYAFADGDSRIRMTEADVMAMVEGNQP